MQDTSANFVLINFGMAPFVLRRCMLNGISFEYVPSEIIHLNQHKCRAKAFQVVIKMQTVAGKRLPPSHKVSKVKGSMFHLPLPLNKTLK